MKKISVSMALLALSATLSSAVLVAPAQAQPPGRMQGGPGGPGGMGGRPGGGGGRGMRGMGRMVEQLNLTPAQQTKIKAITDAMMPQMRSIRQSTSLSEDQKRAKMKSMNTAMTAKISPILTAPQRTKFAALVKQREAMMKKWQAQGGMGGRMGGPGGGGMMGGKPRA